MQRRSTRSMKKSLSPSRDLEATKPVGKSRATRKRITHDEDSGSRSSDSDEDFVLQKLKKTPKKQKRKITDSSSSESDIENYLKPIDEIDLNSSFFKSGESKDEIPSFDKIEKEIFSDIKVTRLSDSDSSEGEEIESKNIEKKIVPDICINNEPIENEEENLQSIKDGEQIALLNFQRLQDYSKKIEEAKRSVEQYQAKQNRENVEMEEACRKKTNIEDLLAIGEAKANKDDSEQDHSASSSVLNIGKESYSDSEQEDWEEINNSQMNEEESLIPKKELEITVEMPSNMKKKKGNDLLAALKRRLNRIKKENQVLIHKVHLLCWIAHGNYVNSILNDRNMLSLGLSLMPSEKSFPSGRIDLDYLEQILKWFKKTVKLVNQTTPEGLSLEELLIEQFNKKEAYSKSMLAMIFILILRSLGIKCRLVLSLQVEPMRPPNSDLHFTGNSSSSKDKEEKSEKKRKKGDNKTISRSPNSIGETIREEKNERESKSTLQIGKLKPNIQSLGEKKEESLKINYSDIKKEESKRSQKSLDLSKEKNSDSKSKSSKDDVKGTSKYFKETGRKASEKNTKQNDKTDDKEKSRKSGSVSKNKGTEKSTTHSEKKDNTEKKINPEKKHNGGSSRQSRGDTKSEKELKESEKKISKDDKSNGQSNPTKNKEEDKTSETKRVTRSNSKSPSVDSTQNVRSKSTSTLKVRLERIDENHSKLRSKSSSHSSKKNTGGKKIPQLDGMDDSMEFKGFKESPNKRKTTDIKSFEEFYSQIYKEVSNEPSSSKTKLKNLKEVSSPGDEDCKSRKHRRSVKKPSYVEKHTTDSEDDFEESPPKKMKSSEKTMTTKIEKQDSVGKKKVNLQKLKSSKSTRVESTKKESPQKVLDVRQDIMNLIEGRISEQKHIDRSKMVKKRKPPKHESESEDSDYVPEPIKKKYHDSDDEFYPKMKVKKRIQIKEEVKKIKKKKPKDENSRRVISSDSEYTEEEIVIKKEEPVKKKRGSDTWLEVFLEMEEKWISVDVVYGQAHCVNELYSRASHPVSYVLAWNNSNHIKDITRRYCQNYNTVTRKLRTDSKWWEESLKPYLGPKNARDREEDDELDRQQQEKPLPTTISEYKNHPLYALERHLLKFEAIYPPNAVPLGYVRNEPVYSRDCVFVCHSRDIWLKQAKVVKRKEQPYKIVKARPKYDKLSNTMITDQMLEIFGPWQVEDYDPPTAENGIVPRNAFGNVDLFKPSMLPKKCVLLQLPGLNKTARRLNIDCASAIVGFDFHGGWSHPVYDGFVVCEEYEDELVAAWNIEQEEQEKKDQEKYEKRVYGNWKKLIRGLLIRERLKAKYGFGQNEGGDSESSSEPKESKPMVAVKKKRRCISDSSDEEYDNKK